MKKALRGGFRLFQDMDKGLLIVTIILFLFGLLNIVTASSSEATANNTSLYYFFYQQLKMIGIGVILGIIILNIDTKNAHRALKDCKMTFEIIQDMKKG